MNPTDFHVVAAAGQSYYLFGSRIQQLSKRIALSTQ